VDAGARYSTHLGNGAHAMLPRHPNHIWAQLADDRLTAGFIADGFHLPRDTFLAMLRAKGPDRAFLVSDTAALAGMPPGRYSSIVGGEVELTAEGRLGIVGTPYLAGAARSLLECVGVAHAAFGLPLEAAVQLATLAPARIAATPGGRVDAGDPADLVIVTFEGERPSIRQAIVGGRECG
jgi:N-acetylglucosamine-6-phosphate deacetylase